MTKLSIVRTLAIKASPEKIYTILGDFNHWTAWSPWLILEPEAKATTSEGGKFYSWEGKRTGSGEMRMAAEKKNESLDIDLTFLKPWKSTSKVRFELKPKGELTEVSWYMEGSLPFYMFWMKKMMEAYVGMDYERGLHLLKDYVEDGSVHSKLSFDGIVPYPGCSYVGLRSESTLQGLTDVMKKDFDKLTAWADQNKNLITGAPFSIYHAWDVVKGKTSYTAGFPVKSHPDSLSAGFLKGTIPSTAAYKITHRGPYHHLGNAWSAHANLSRSKVYKLNRKVAPFEVYTSMPGTVPDNELITEVFFATK